MQELPAVRLRALTSADVPALRSWGGISERFLGIAELLEAAVLPGTITWLAEDPEGHVVAVFQAAPEEDGKRSVALLVHPGRRGAGLGTACVVAAVNQPCFAGEVLTAAIDCENVASLRCFARSGFRFDAVASSRDPERFVHGEWYRPVAATNAAHPVLTAAALTWCQAGPTPALATRSRKLPVAWTT